MKIINYNNVRVIKKDRISYQNSIKINFTLNANVSNQDLDLFDSFFKSFVNYQIINENVKFDNKIKQSLSLSALNVSGSQISNRREKKLQLEFSFYNFNIDKTQENIKKVIFEVFNLKPKYEMAKDLAFTIDNRRINFKNLSQTNLSLLQQDWKILHNLNTNNISQNVFNMLTNQEQTNEAIFNEFINAYRNIFQNFSSAEIFVTGKVNEISDAIIDLVNKIDFIAPKEQKDVDFATDIAAGENISIAGDTSRTIRYIGIKTTNKKNEFLNGKFAFDRMYKFYLESVRGEHNLIYSPMISSLISPNVIYKLEHEVQPKTLHTMLNVENEFFDNKFLTDISETELNEIKLAFNKGLFDSLDNENEEFAMQIVELFEDIKLEGNETIENLYVRAKKHIDSLSKKDFSPKNFILLTKFSAEAK